METNLNIGNWWDGRIADSFFPLVYRMGDESLEGNLDSQELDTGQRTKRECDLIESILKLRPGSKILDCPCGYGRHSIELARRGYKITGVDLCPSFIEEAKLATRFLSSRAKCSFFEGDMRDLLPQVGKHDACINMFLSFGFFNDQDNQKVLHEFHRVLKRDGILLIHSDVNPERVAEGKYGDRPIRNLRNGSKLIVDESIDVHSRILNGQWKIEKHDAKPITRSYQIKIYSHAEMQRMLTEAGFTDVITIHPNDDRSEIQVLPQEVLYVARKRAYSASCSSEA
jgi:ubiquinone/menaquinone biosynthesis C-methylase UbiE